MAAKDSGGATRPKTGDGETDFAYREGEKGPPQESMTKLLNKYVPHDQEAFDRLLKPSQKQQAQALDVAKVAMAGLDSVMAFLQQRRKTCGDQIEADEAECAWIEKEVARKQKMVDKIKAHHAQCKLERDTMQEGLTNAISTMQESVKYCHKMTQKTNSSIARLTRTMVPQGPPNYLTTGVQEKSMTLTKNKFRNSTTIGAATSSPKR